MKRNPNNVKDIKKILQVETRRNRFIKIKFYFGKEKSGLTCLVIPSVLNHNISNKKELFLANQKDIELSTAAV